MDNVNPTFIFPGPEISNVSTDFVVSNDTLGLIQIKGLQDCDYILIEYRFGVDCDESWEPLIYCGKQVTICFPSTNFILPIPGRYRLVVKNEDNEEQTDPNYLNNLKIQYRQIQTRHDISDWYHPCCVCCDD